MIRGGGILKREERLYIATNTDPYRVSATPQIACELAFVRKIITPKVKFKNISSKQFLQNQQRFHSQITYKNFL